MFRDPVAGDARYHPGMTEPALPALALDGLEAVVRRLRVAGKPDPALFLEAARRLGVSPYRAAVVEDALAGVAAGHRGGFGLVVGVDRGGQTDALAAAGADVVVTDLGDPVLDGTGAGQGGP